ncbi:MAG: bifunctional (p)ppGpp synthetase/guanosine-3',5'-bis(diphosphate) 3'-pyrophosphohydrolase [Saprospiraceae bacterium]|nr:bifunctional (p)ppGpp synthetase/guanosine-3',5'-bis(diphosphate) 3'-pyrophosphohydrolase [Candidatus Defluviibacterium haderslevense]
MRDWITTPKSNGYESLHTTVIGPHGPVYEVQIRSQRMDDISENGYASHWKYKECLNIHSIYDHWTNSIRDMLKSNTMMPGILAHDFKSNLYGF